MKPLTISFVALVFASSAFGQTGTDQGDKKLSFSSINQVGMLTGGTGQAATVQTINGVQSGQWFTGIGAGMHYYGMRSIPLFADVRRTFGQRPNRPFVYVDGGVNIPWATDMQLLNKGYEASTTKGLYYDIGAGCKLMGKKNRAVLLSAGYNYKRMVNRAQLYTNWPWPTTPVYETYTNQFRTVAIKLGLQF